MWELTSGYIMQFRCLIVCNAPSFPSRDLTTPLVKLSFRLDGLFGIITKSDFKGVETLIPFISSSIFRKRERARELERIREKGRRRLEIFEDQDHQSSVWVINYS